MTHAGKIKASIRPIAKSIVERVRRILLIEQAPFIVTVVLAAAAWCTDHVVERATKTALIAYRIERADVRDVEICTGSKSLYPESRKIDIENLGDASALSQVQIDVITRGVDRNPAKLLVRKLCWLSGGHANPNPTVSEIFDENVLSSTHTILPQASRAYVLLDQLLPRDRGRIIIPLKSTPVEIDLRLRIATAAKEEAAGPNKDANKEGRSGGARLIEEGFVTYLVRYELALMLSLLGILVITAVTMLWVLTEKAK